MIGALLYWRAHSLRNQVVSWVRRLRQPKYLLSFLAGALYVYFIFLRRARFSGRMPGFFTPELVVYLGAFLLFLLLFAYTVLAWVGAGPEARLKFSEAEIAFLFPAPLTRRRLIHFNLLSSQFTVLLSSVIMAVILNRWSFLGGNAFIRAVGWWLILSTVSLYQTAMNFIAARTVERFGSRVKYRALLLLVLVAFEVGRALWATAAAPNAFALTALPAGVGAYLAHWIHSGGGLILRPFAWIVAPFAAGSMKTFALALPLGLPLPLLCYFVIVWLEVPFRDNSLAAASRRAQVRAARRAPGGTPVRINLKARRAPFALPPRGRPELAFLWKNLIGIQAWFNLRIAGRILLICVAIVMILSRQHPGGHDRAAATVVLTVSLIAGFYVMLLGPQLIRQDLRSDLHHADVLKTYPLPGWQIVGGQMLTPAILLSLMLWLAALAGGWAVLSGADPQSDLGFGARVVGLFCVGALVPAVVLLQLIVPNAAALLFPAWHQSVRSRGGGIEAIGQRLIFTFGQFIGVVVALMPAAVLGVLIALATIHYVGWSLGFIFSTVAMLVVVLGEVWIGLWWLGERFEKLDIATEFK